ncbi:cysteine hydrolase family protein [Paenibacillus humicola]|uniref:cysteine hydrolase family protein n=1 Tax=Paenibacillus humicola TaxID=3110540 RepID=UPI00237BDA68|nr:isochorismatase family cysteine hydrolase [Paenibacillus humicola]
MKYGNGANYWLVEGSHADISRGAMSTATIELDEQRGTLEFDPARSALIIIDMQNFFCSPLLDRPDGTLKLVPAIASAVKSGRRLGMKIVWVNWGNRPDTANLPPNMLYSLRANGPTHIGRPLPGDMGLALVKDSWSAAIVDELKDSCDESDYVIEKYRTSGFPGTILDQTLRASGINTLFYAGVNLDQCVMFTLLDAAFLGYDNVHLKDCTATTSPPYAAEGALYNMRNRTFTASSESLLAAVVTRKQPNAEMEAAHEVR